MSASGFITDITDITGLSQQFTDIRQIYVSRSGYTRLFTAVRYGKRFVLKCLKPESTLAPVYQQALRKEFEIGYQLDHPNICRTIGFENIPDLGNVIILEYIDGITLADVISSKTSNASNSTSPDFPFSTFHFPLDQFFSALEYIHSKQIIHRDLKPTNIMITHNGHTLKLIDFSLADSDTFDILKQAAGTRNYIAPEQLLPGAVADVRADIYSLGVIMRQLNDVMPNRTFAAIADQCCQRDPDKRPSSITTIDLNANHSIRHHQFLYLLLLLILAVASIVFIMHTLATKGYL